MATLEKEDFWGCELKKGSGEVKFNPEFEDSELSQVEHKLILSQACLGAKASGRCLVQVTAHDYKGDEQKNVIASLQPGSTEMCPLNLSFNPPATFKLIEGAGPVHLTGNHVQSLAEDELDSSEESDEDEAPQLVDSKASMKKKRPLPSSTPSGPPKKIAKPNKEEEEEEEDEEESSDEEEEEEEAPPTKPAPAKKDDKKKPQKKEIVEENEDDDDESDEDGDDDDDDDEKDEDYDGSDSDGQEESEEESEEEESDSDDEEESDEITKTLTGKRESPRKAMTNGISNKKDGKKPLRSQQKTPQQKTPPQKSDKPKDVDSIKKALLKSPALPKKMDKFKNLMRSSYKITDDATVKDIWEYVQNNKK